MGKLMRFSWSWGYPNSWMVYNGRSYLKWMIWGYSLLGNRYMYIIYIHTWKMHRLMIPLELRSWKVAQYFTIYDVHFHLWRIVVSKMEIVPWPSQAESPAPHFTDHPSMSDMWNMSQRTSWFKSRFLRWNSQKSQAVLTGSWFCLQL